MTTQPAVPRPAVPSHFAEGNPVQRLLPLVGGTPLLELWFDDRGTHRRIFAKLESLNATGSIKDRMAVHIIGRAYEEGVIAPGDEIVEATSGNTGIAFASVGRSLGHPVRIFMPDWMSRERKELLRAMGATLVMVTKEEGGFLGSIALVEDWVTQHTGTFAPRQFANPWNVEAHEVTTGPEILAQLKVMGLVPDAFLAGVGTGGTVMGVGACLRSARPETRIHPLQPAESPVLTEGHKVGCHRIQGISDEFIPEILDLSRLDEPIAVPDGDAILMAQRLGSSLGLSVGISSGANLVGALCISRELGPEAVVVTVLSDCGKKYLSTDLLRDEPVRPDYVSPQVETLGFTAHTACLCAAH